MAQDAVEFILRARDESAAVLVKARGGITGLTGAVGDLASKAGLLGALTAGVASVVGGVLVAAKSFSDMVEALDRLQASIGVPIEKLQVLHEVFRRAGLAAEDADRALTFMARAIGRGDPILAKLGITTRDVFEATLQLGDAFARGSDFAAKQELALKVLGRSSSQAVGTLETLRREVERVGSQIERSGGSLEGVAVQARDLDRQLDDLGTAWLSMTNRTLSATVPWATKILTVVQAIGEAVFALAQQWVLAFQVISGQIGIFDNKVRRLTIERLQTLVGEIAKAIAASTGVIAGPTSAGPSRTTEGDEILRRAAVDGGGRARGARGAAEPVITVLPQWSPLRQAADLASAQKTLENTLALSNAEIDKQVIGLAQLKTGMAGAQRATLEAGVVILEWQLAAESITSTAGVLSASLQGLWDGLQSGAGAAFSQITARWKYSANVINNTTHAMVDAMLAELARVVAAKVFNIILDIVKLAASGGASAATGGWQSIANPERARSPRSERAGMNVNVYALDTRSIERSLTAPGGSLRLAFEDAALRGG